MRLPLTRLGPITRSSVQTMGVYVSRLLIQLVLLLLLARWLGPTEFGEFAGVAALAMGLGTLSAFGLGFVVLAESAKSADGGRQCWRRHFGCKCGRHRNWYLKLQTKHGRSGANAEAAADDARRQVAAVARLAASSYNSTSPSRCTADPMRVLLLSTSYPQDSGDWRGVFIRHLVHALARVPDVSLRVWAPPGELPPTTRGATTASEAAWLAQLMADGGIAHRLRSGGFDALRRSWQLLRQLRSVCQRERDVDLYHINWLQTALPLPNNGKPALISVLGTDLKLLTLPLVARLLRRVMRRRRVVICPNAEWMREPLEAAFGDVAEVQPVLFGIDPVWYGIERKPDEAAPIWLSVTRLTRDKLGPLFDWSRPLFDGKTRQLHLFGPMQEAIDVPAWVHYHGPATPEQLARDWFGRAQGLITLSRHAEGRPQVMLEAMAARLPIIASDMPAHAGLVQHDITGQLCADTEGYAEAIARLEEPTFNRGCGESAREWVGREIGTWDDCAQRYVRLYRRLLAEADG